MKDQSGSPVKNATVSITGVNYDKISADPGELDERANELLQQTKDVVPNVWQPNLKLKGDGLIGQASANYVAAHTASDWEGADPSLSDPRLRFQSGAEVHLSVWDPTVGNGLLSAQDAVDEDLRGATQSDTKIVIEQVGPDGSVMSEQTVATDPEWDAFGRDKHSAAEVTLPNGFYRVYAEGNPAASYIIQVGPTDQMYQGYMEDLENKAGQLSDRADRIRDLINQGKFEQTTVTTDENGSFSVADGTFGPKVNTVAITAHKGPVDLLDEDPQNVSVQDIRTLFETVNVSASIYLSTAPVKTGVPSQNVSVNVREVEAAPFMNTTRYSELQDRLSDIFNESFENATALLQQGLGENRKRLKNLYEETQSLADENEALRERYRNVLARYQGGESPGEVNVDVDAGELNTDELQQRVSALRESVTSLRSTLQTSTSSSVTGPGDGTTGNISTAMTVPTDLSKDAVTVIGHWSNGTSFQVPEEYVAVDQSVAANLGSDMVGSSTVRVEDYPVGENDPASLSFEYLVASGEGFAAERTQGVTNPTFDGEVPELQSISYSTLQPGPDQVVKVTLTPGSTPFGNVTAISATAPDGTEANASVTGERTAEFTSAGEGVHRLQLTFTDSSGNEYVFTDRVTAADTDRARPPGIEIVESQYGLVAAVGDGLEAGDVTVDSGGSGLQVVAQLNQTADVPTDPVHVYTRGANVDANTDVTVRVVRGSDQQSVTGQHIRVEVHMGSLPDGATLYRNGQALPMNGETSTTLVNRTSSQTHIETITDTQGVVTIEANADPSIVQSVQHWIDLNISQNIPDVPVLSGGLLLLMFGGGGGGLLFRRRRRRQGDGPTASSGPPTQEAAV